LRILTGELRIPEDESGENDGSSEKPGPEAEPEAESDDELPDQDNIEAATDEICHSISSLFRLTVVINNLSSRDRLEKLEKIDMSDYESFDINHVRKKYPPINEENVYLLERLGKANTKRWQLLKYNEKHHGKIAGRRPEAASNPDGSDSIVTGDGEAQAPSGEFYVQGFEFSRSNYEFGTGSTTAQTTVSTVHDVTSQTLRRAGMHDYDDAQSVSGFSLTSYASSTWSASGSRNVRAPPPPNGFDGNPFECPYCSCIIGDIRDSDAWQ
jgi:hypothetical protein